MAPVGELHPIRTGAILIPVNPPKPLYDLSARFACVFVGNVQRGTVVGGRDPQGTGSHQIYVKEETPMGCTSTEVETCQVL